MSKHTTLRKKLLVTLIKTAIVTAAVGPAISWAQSSDAGLRGKAPADSDITAKNIATGLTRRTKAAADGSYALVGLPPGTYTVDAGPGTAKTVTLSVASTGTLDLTATAAAGATTSASTLEGISVTATALQEVKTSEIGNTISLHQINTIPQISRNFLEFADTVPGMVFNVDSSGNTSLRGGAQNTSSTNVYIDGVGQKSYVKEGGISGQNGSQGNPFPQLAIGEYKVITSNYKAEYDQVSSAAVIAQTKSGTNEFHGEIFGDYTSDNYRDETPSEEFAGKKTASHEKEYGFAIGGPIIQDQMHFFFTYEKKNFDQPVVVVPGVIGLNNLLPTAAQSQLGTVGLPFTEDLYFAKVDWEFTDRDRVELSSKVRKEDQNGGYGAGSNAQAAGYATQNNDTRIDARWEHNADNWTNEVLLTYEKSFNNPIAFSGGNGQVYTAGAPFSTNDDVILTTGAASPLATQNKGQKGPAIQDDLTFSNFNWYGDHTIKMGVKYKEVTLSAQDSGDASAQFFYNVGPNGTDALPYKVFFAAPAVGTNPLVTSKDKQFGTYIQDDWAVNDKLTLNLGVRWDIERNPSYLNYVTPASVVAAYNSQDPNAPTGQTYAQSLAKGGVNLNDYISNGHNRHAFKDEWQPRLGFSYDLNGDEEHVIIGGVGRSYDRDLYDYLQLEQTKYSLSQYNYYFDNGSGCYKGGSPCIAYDPKYLTGVANLQSLVTASTAGKEIDAINNNLKAPYSDQVSIGMRNKVGDWNTSATVAHVESKDGFAFTLGNRYPNGAFWQNGSQPWGNGVPGFGSLIIGNNAISTRTTSLLLSADKPYTKESGWAATIAYTYSDAKQNRDINEHYSFDQATLGQYPFITSNAVAKHRLVATGSIDGPWGITYSGKLTLATPLPNNGYLNYSYPITAANGANNLPVAATPEGQSFLFGGKNFGYRDISLSASKDFDLTRGIDLILRLDVLNVLNYKNYTDIGQNYGTNVLNPNPVSYLTNGNISGVPRTEKFTIRLTW